MFSSPTKCHFNTYINQEPKDTLLLSKKKKKKHCLFPGSVVLRVTGGTDPTTETALPDLISKD